MSLLEELSDKGACVAWNPLASHSQLLALGTKDSGRVGFDEVGGVLEIHGIGSSRKKNSTTQPGSANAEATLIGSSKITSRLATLDWSNLAGKSKEYPYGVIAGGMGDGSVVIWDPAVLVAADRTMIGKSGRLASIQRHNGAVSGLGFNPHKNSSHLLASGGVDSKVFVIALDRPDNPNVFVPAPPPCSIAHEAEISKCAWNTQVPHILGTAGGDGLVVIWDLRKKKPWCQLRDAARSPVSDLAWNPDQGLHVMTASGDDRNPVLKLWDLRSSTTLPLATLHGHTEGVLSIGWCPTDPSLLVSSAKDNRTLLWDLYTMEPIYELPVESSTNPVRRHSSHQRDLMSSTSFTNDQMFGGLSNAGNSRRYQVLWNPKVTGLLATCSFDRKVQVFSMVGAGTSKGRAPKWLTRPCGVSFGFGGKLVSFGKPADESQPIVVRISHVQQDPALVAASQTFESALKDKDLNGFCVQKELRAKTIHDKHIWQFMQVIFEPNSREKLLTHLGFNTDDTAKEVDQPIAKQRSVESGGDVRGNGEVKTEADVFLDIKKITAPKGREDRSKEEDEKLAGKRIKRALLVGNFSAAVKSCLEVDNMADALLLASCGGAELWVSTQAEYFDRHGGSSGYLEIASAIVNSELHKFVEKSDLTTWKETLAVLSTYAKSDEFATLCELLGECLESEGNDRQSANLCYMCAVNIPKTVNIWAEDLQASVSGSIAKGGVGLVPGCMNPLALQEFVEKIITFSQAEPGAINDSKVAKILFLYASLLAAEGEMQAATRYLVGQTDEACAILRDRLFHATQESGTPPPFPFASCTVGAGTTAAAKTLPATERFWGNVSNSAFGSSMNACGGTPTLEGQSSIGSGAEPPLPLEWSQIYDPTRQAYYYHNTLTFESQWERPVVPRLSTCSSGSSRSLKLVYASTSGASFSNGVSVDGKPVVGLGTSQMNSSFNTRSLPSTGFQASVPAPSFSQSTPTNPLPASAATTMTIASSNGGVAAPAPAPSPPARTLTPTEAIDACLALGGDTAVVVQAVQSLTAMLEGMQLSPSQHKMLGEVKKASHILFCKAVAGDVESDVMEKVSKFFHLLSVRDMHGASVVHQELSNTCWNTHKDWLKGLKHSSTLVAKAFQ